MKICVLVPSEENLTQGGVRIRYRRIEKVLREQGHELRVMPIQELANRAEFVHDVYLISKCYDARAFVAAHRLAASERCVGVDLFDDYFSQSGDSRFVGLRYWLQTLLPLADFALCSTQPMRELASRAAPGLPVHVMNDAAAPLDLGQMRAVLRNKLEFARRRKTLQVSWFGIGDNPHFLVGLADLVAFGGELASLRADGIDVQLSVLTNSRAMTKQGLAMLKRLALPYAVEEWTEEREQRLLARSLACFLPVNAQNFSVAKSLNRAVTALCAGCQVLSSGYPLYEPLAPLVYRDPAQLRDDLRSESLLLREDTLPLLGRLMEKWADAAGEGRALAQFLEEQCERKLTAAVGERPQLPAAVIHGRSTTGEVHKLAQRKGVLSVCSPFCTASLNYDVRFTLDAEGAVEVLLADRLGALLAPEIHALLAPHGKILETSYQKLAAAQLIPGFSLGAAALARMGSAASVAASYPAMMAGIAQVLQHLFPGIRCYHSELALLPWSLAPQGESRTA